MKIVSVFDFCYDPVFPLWERLLKTKIIHEPVSEYSKIILPPAPLNYTLKQAAAPSKCVGGPVANFPFPYNDWSLGTGTEARPPSSSVPNTWFCSSSWVCLRRVFGYYNDTQSRSWFLSEEKMAFLRDSRGLQGIPKDSGNSRGFQRILKDSREVHGFTGILGGSGGFQAFSKD